MSAPRVLLVCREPLAQTLAPVLRQHGFTPLALDAESAWARLERAEAEALLIDLGLPRTPGLAFGQAVRRHHPCPQIMLCDPPGRLERIVALEAAADDAVDHDCAPREIVARLQSLLRRGAGARATASDDVDAAGLPAALRFAGWTWDPLAGDLSSPQGQRVDLTPAERRLLAHFLRRAQTVCRREDLDEGGELAPPVPGARPRRVDLLVSRLRQKLGEDPRAPQLIKTVRGGGYLFDVAVLRSDTARPGRQTVSHTPAPRSA